MSPPTEPLTYVDISEVCRNEQRLKNLVGVRVDFYPAIRECKERLKSDYEKEYSIDPFSTKTKLASKALTEFIDLVEMTFEARMKKILAMALRASEGNKIDTSKLTHEEKEIFDTVFNLMKDRHASLIEGKAGRAPEAEPTQMLSKPTLSIVEAKGEAPVVPAPPTILQPQPVAASTTVIEAQPRSPPAVVKPTPAIQKAPDVPPAVVAPAANPPVAAEKAAAPGFMVLRILEDIPPFAASDRNYALKKEDLVSLPQGIAKTLIARKKAVGVQHHEIKI